MFSRKQMIKLLAPLIVEQIMAVLVGMVDVVMVAAVGESAVSGVSLVDSISVLIIQIMGAPVSYTHLDVYKRQDYRTFLGNGPGPAHPKKERRARIYFSII